MFLVRGFVRGRPLNPNQLVHVCGVGVGCLKGIWQVEDPLPFCRKSSKSNCETAVRKDSSETDKRTLLAMASKEFQESLDMEAEPDPLSGEQTWPTEEEVGGKQATYGLVVILVYVLVVVFLANHSDNFKLG